MSSLLLIRLLSPPYSMEKKVLVLVRLLQISDMVIRIPEDNDHLASPYIGAVPRVITFCQEVFLYFNLNCVLQCCVVQNWLFWSLML